MLKDLSQTSFFSGMLAILALAGTLISLTASAQTSGTACHVLTSAQNVPQGFGAAYNLFSTAKELLLNVECGATSNATLSVGNGQNTMYVYRFGYEWQNGGWKQIALVGQELVASDWYVGAAKANLFRSQTQLAEDNFVVAYTCLWHQNAWKCGCRDSSCSTNYWQLQAFRSSAATGGSTGGGGDGSIPTGSYPDQVDAVEGALLHLDLNETTGEFANRKGGAASLVGAGKRGESRLGYLGNGGSLLLQGGRVSAPVGALGSAGTITVFVRGDADVRNKTLIEYGNLRVRIGGNNDISLTIGNKTISGGHLMAKQRGHVAVSWGQKGMRLYQDGMVSATLPDTISPSGASSVSFGASASGAEAFRGWIDEAAAFGKQLTDLQVRNLSQTDLFIAGNAIRYVSPSGSNGNNGSSRSSAWQTIAHAFANHSQWDTLVVAGGSYNETGVTLSAAGSFDRPKLVMRDPTSSAKPVIDGSLPAYRGKVSGWEQVDSGRKIWRTSASMPSGYRLAGWHGIDPAGQPHWYNMVPARDVMKNAATSETYDYPGPMTWVASGRLYMRLDAWPNYTRPYGYPYPQHPGSDPRSVDLRIYSDKNGLTLNNASHVLFDGIDVKHHYIPLKVQGPSKYVQIRESDMIGMFRGFWSDTQWAGGGEGRHIDLHTVFITLGIPQTLGWANLRNWDQPYYVGDMRSIGFQFTVNGDSSAYAPVYNFVRNSWIMDYFYVSNWNRGITLNHSLVNGTYQILSNSADGFIYNEMHHNIIRAVSYCDEEHKETRSDFYSHVGKTWWHHNVIHPPRPWYDGGTNRITESFKGCTAHGGGLPGQAINQWNNTFIMHNTNKYGTLGDGDNHTSFNSAYIRYFDDRIAHRGATTEFVINNIFAMYPTHIPKDAIKGTAQGPPSYIKYFDGRIMYRANPTGKLAQFRDGNVYHGIGTSAGDLVKFNAANLMPKGEAAFDTLAAFQNSSHAQDVQNQFGMKPEASSRDADPVLALPEISGGAAKKWQFENVNYRPGNASAVSNPVPITQHDWPGRDLVDYRGALSPDPNYGDFVGPFRWDLGGSWMRAAKGQ